MAFNDRNDWRSESQGEPYTPVFAEDLMRYEKGIKDAHTEIDGRLSDERLKSTYAPILKPDIGTLAMSKYRLDMDVNFGLAGDSTGNAADEWFDLLATALGADRSNMRVEIPHWNDTTQANSAATVVQAGTSGAAGIAFHDTFNRTAADLYGTTPDIGPVWGRDGANATGDWSLDGTDAVRTADATVGTLLATAAPGEMTTWASANVSTTQNGTARSMRLYSQMKDNSNSIYLALSVSAVGVPSFTISKRIGGTVTVLNTAATVPTVATDSASNELTLELSLSGTTVTGKVNSQAITGTLLPADLTALSGASMAGFAGSTGGAGDRIHEFKVTVGVPAAPPKATFYNASMPGSTLTYQQSRLAAMFPTPLDVLFVSSCHNYGADTPAQYAAKLDEFIAAFRAVQPSAGIVICSQNPQKPPASGVTAHRSRVAHLRAYAARRGFGYVPVAEEWAKQANGGVSLILADGIHPTTGANGSGSALWRDAAKAYLATV
ncbi:SGNH/GDSL hydrolase family protein [Rhodococcus qingshengii]|uniref:SGNH/GDSL hydrolase family protein n=1 Tax=Rhodococcus qingshengii TaxID=334542 RepID=A0AAW6LK90_RHOSG|nr:SGNH/GDSL hydrolase family protein [Rhodococcus qingshengii]MDE8648077.1 SGNH/GDSL hydrolase family protein [Rhodococcus qingshengii]